VTVQSPPRPAGGKRPADRRKLPTAVVALIVFGLVVASLVAAIAKPNIKILWSELTGSQTRVIHFAGDHFLLEASSKVKVAGIDVGVVDTVRPDPAGGADVTVVVDRDSVSEVGASPSARIRPTTLLGGLYYVEVIPGGDRTADWTDEIPIERTQLPVEVDDVAEALQPDALTGAKAAVTQLDSTLGGGGNDAIHQLLSDAPGTLGPAAGVLTALQGTRPDVDLQGLVTNLQKTSAVLTKQDGQLSSIVENLRDTSQVLGDTSQPVASAIDRLPATLDTTNAGLKSLDGSLDRLKDTAGPARPSIQQLDTLLGEAQPVLADARPLVSDLRAALVDTRPLVQGLVPASDGLKQVLDDVNGPVIDRLNDPVHTALFSGFTGTGPYKATQSDDPFYKELGYMFTGLDKAGAYTDPNGHAVAFHPGAGLGTASGVGNVSLEQMYQQLFHGPEGR
jgi:phospholipid/cholesterol/gamma-HCH transport system substrate-binding protein